MVHTQFSTDDINSIPATIKHVEQLEKQQYQESRSRLGRAKISLCHAENAGKIGDKMIEVHVV